MKNCSDNIKTGAKKMETWVCQDYNSRNCPIVNKPCELKREGCPSKEPKTCVHYPTFAQVWSLKGTRHNKW